METSSRSGNIFNFRLNASQRQETRTPTILVIMVIPGHVDNLSESVQSVLGQTFQDIEIILVICGELDSRMTFANLDDERLFFLQPADHPGQYEARELGLQNAKGKHITYLDAGEVYAKNHLALLFHLLQLTRDGKTLQVLTSQLIEKNQKEIALLLELARIIMGSKSWHILLLFRQLRAIVAPRGSLLSQIGVFVLRGLRFRPDENSIEKQAVREILTQIREKDQAMQVVNLQVNLMEQAVQSLLVPENNTENTSKPEQSIQIIDSKSAKLENVVYHRAAPVPEPETKPEIFKLAEKSWEILKTQGLITALRKEYEHKKRKPSAPSTPPVLEHSSIFQVVKLHYYPGLLFLAIFLKRKTKVQSRSRTWKAFYYLYFLLNW